MLKQIVKSCLVAAMAVAMAAPAMADVTVGGRVGAAFVQTAVKDGATTMDMRSDARINLTGSKEMGSWKASAFVELDIVESDAHGQRDKWVKFENDAMAIKFGKQFVHGVEAGINYHTGDRVGTVQWIGEYFGARTDYLSVSLKDAGVNVWIGMNEKSDGGANADENYAQTDVGAFYGGSFGAVSVNAMYASVSKKIDEKNGGVVGGAEDGYAGSEMAVGVGYNISDTMGIGFNYGMISDKGGDATDGTKVNMMDLNFFMGLDDNSGIFASYGTKSTTVESADAVAATNTLVEYNTKIGGATVFAIYNATTDNDGDTGASSIGLGTRYGF